MSNIIIPVSFLCASTMGVAILTLIGVNNGLYFIGWIFSIGLITMIINQWFHHQVHTIRQLSNKSYGRSESLPNNQPSSSTKPTSLVIFERNLSRVILDCVIEIDEVNDDVESSEPSQVGNGSIP